MFFLSGLLSAVVIVALAIVPALFLPPTKSGRGALVALGVVAIVVYTGVNWWIGWGYASAFGFGWGIYSQSWVLWTFELAIIGVLTMFVYDKVRALSAAAIVLAGLMFVQGTLNLKTWAGWDASSQLAAIQVTNHADPGEYPETDANHIVAVPIETARQLADQAMNATNITNTYYNRTEPALQSIAGHLYWVAMLEIDGWPANYEAMKGKVPGYIVIDAENPGQPARYVDKNADGTPIVVNYQPSGMLEHHLGRHVRESGYSSELLGSWVLELDDNWRPYYTGSIDVLPSATFTGTVPAKTISVDAQTGEIKVYDLEDTPQWIDRIYSATTVKMILNWWGEWGTAGFAPIYWGNGNRFSVAKDQEPTLVYTKSGHPEWQVQMSSNGNSEAASHVVLFSGRDNKVDVYSIPGLQLESSAAKTVYQSGQNVHKNVPTHISLHKIYGKLTWVMPLVSADSSSKDDPKPADKSSFQGIALMKAEGSSGSDIALDTTLAGALAEYRNNVLRGGTTKPSEDSTLETAKGTVSQLSPVMKEGELNVFYFRLGTDDRTYKMSIDPNDAAQTVERPFIKVGAKVAISYRNSGDKKGDVVAYDDLGM